MKKRLLTFVTSYLLLAAFIGSPEAKMINTAYAAGAGIQFAGSGGGGPADSGWALLESTEGMEWLLAYYFGTEDDSSYVELEQSKEPSEESLAANEDSDEEFASADGMWLDHNLVAYGDGLYDLAAADQSAVSGSVSENNPQIESGMIPREFYDPPAVIIYQSNKEELTPLDSPVIYPTPSPASNTPEITPVTANIPPASVNTPPPAIPIGEPLVPVTPNGPGKPGHFPPQKPGWERPNNGLPPPAPVPEPATMLLLSSSLAGLAFTRMRRK